MSPEAKAEQTVLNPWFSPRRVRFWLALFILCYLLGGFLLLPSVAKNQLETRLSDYLQHPVSLGELRFNPLLLTVDAQDFQLSAEDGSALISFERLRADVQLSSVLRRALTFREILLDKPYVHIERAGNGSINLLQMLQEARTAAPSPPQATDDASEPPRLVIQSFSLVEGYVDVTDHTHSTHFSTSLGPVTIELNDISTLLDAVGTNKVVVTSEEGTRISWTGELQPNPLFSEGRIAGEGGHVPMLYRYYQDQLGFIVAEGKASFTLDYRLETLPNAKLGFTVTNLDFVLSDLGFLSASPEAEEQRFFALPELKLTGFYLRWPQQEAGAKALQLSGIEAQLWRDQQGQFSYQQWFPQTAAAPTADDQVVTTDNASGDDAAAATNTIAGDDPTTPAVTEASTKPAAPDTADHAEHLDSHAQATDVDTGAVVNTETETETETETVAAETDPAVTEADTETGADTGAAAEAADEASAPPSLAAGWDLQLGELSIGAKRLAFDDFSLAQQGSLALTNSQLTLSELSSHHGALVPVHLTAALESGGQITAEGQLTVQATPDIDAQLQFSELNVTAIQPWLAETSHALIKAGTGSGAFAVSHQASSLSITGDVNVAGLKVSDSVKRESLLGWRALEVDNIEYTASTGEVADTRLDISEVILWQPYLRVRISEDGTTNFHHLSRANTPSQAVPEKNGNPRDPAAASDPATSLNTTIGMVRVRRGALDFEDLSLPFPFNAKMRELKGRASTLSTTSQAASKMQLEGEIGEFGYARIDGSVLAGDPTASTDVRLRLRNAPFAGLSPYTIKFAGRRIDDGSLDLDLNYAITDGQLNAHNKVVIDDLVLGEKVQHPDAKNLPLGLAVSLLTGPDGRIDIDLPVTGDVNDPQFKIGGVIMRALGTFIAKVVSSPFRALAGLAGVDTENFDTIEFEHGRADLTPPEQEKMGLLADALIQRPQIKLAVPGAISREADATALQAISVDARIAEQLAKRKRSDDDTQVAKQRRKVLERMYKAAFRGQSLRVIKREYHMPVNPDRPGGRSRLDEVAYAEGLRERLIAGTKVSSQDLDALGRARAEAVVEALLVAKTKGGQIAEQRVALGPTEEVKLNKQDLVPLKLQLAK